MHHAEDLTLDDCFWLDEGCLVAQDSLEIGRACLGTNLMQVGLGLCEVDVFRGRDDADGDDSAMSVEEKGVEEFVIVNEEVNMQPEGVSKNDFGELGDAVAASRGSYNPAGLLDDLIACNQLAQEVQIGLVGPLFALLLKHQVLFQHETH